MLVQSNTANAEPSLAKLLRDTDAPNCKKSSTESDDPNLPMPNNDNAAPKRAKLRKDIEDPT
jgi:hypothetical protein